MTKSLLLGTILGGLTAFIWSSISWAVLTWHEKPVLAFQNEDDVAAVIASHSTQSGIYILPGTASTEGMSADQKKTAETVRIARMQKGPLMFAELVRACFPSHT